MIEITVIFGLYMAIHGAISLVVFNLLRDDKRELEDRIMALSKPESLVVHKSLRGANTNTVTYVDDEELNPAFSQPGHDLEDD